MGNVLKQSIQDQIRALGQLGWSLRRIEEATGVRRETVSRYLKAAGISVREPRRHKLPVPGAGYRGPASFGRRFRGGFVGQEHWFRLRDDDVGSGSQSM